jgi:hypothetical protein
MFSIESLVPDFDQALAAVPGRAETAQILEESIEGATLAPRTAALIRVAVAQRVGGAYARWAMTRIAARQLVSAEDIFLATTGTAHDPIENVVINASVRLASCGRSSHPSDFAALSHLLGEERATEIVAQVALSMLACEALAAIAPSVGAKSERSRPGA